MICTYTRTHTHREEGIEQDMKSNVFHAKFGSPVSVATPSDPHSGSALLQEGYTRTREEQSADLSRHWGLDDLRKHRQYGGAYLDYREVESLDDDEFDALFGVHPLKVLEEQDRAQEDKGVVTTTEEEGMGE